MSANPRNDLEPPCLKNVFQVVKQPKFIFCQANACFWIYLKWLERQVRYVQHFILILEIM